MSRSREYDARRVRWPHPGLRASLPGVFLAALDRARTVRDWSDLQTRDEQANPLWAILLAFGPCEAGNQVHRQLAWLTFFAARRALPCWELYCDGAEPHAAIEAVSRWLKQGKMPVDWEPLCRPASPAYRGKLIVDCRECDTGCAAEAAAHAAQFARGADPGAALDTILYTYLAFDQSPLCDDDDFKAWFVEVAVPVAYHQREMTLRERHAFQSYDPDSIPLSREREAREG